MLQFEEATKELAEEIMQHKPEDHIEMENFQVMFYSSSVPISLRDLKVLHDLLTVVCIT